MKLTIELLAPGRATSNFVDVETKQDINQVHTALNSGKTFVNLGDRWFRTEHIQYVVIVK